MAGSCNCCILVGVGKTWGVAFLISVVTTCRCCKAWWRGRCWSDLNMLGVARLGVGVVGPADHTSKLMCYVLYL